MLSNQFRDLFFVLLNGHDREPPLSRRNGQLDMVVPGTRQALKNALGRLGEAFFTFLLFPKIPAGFA